MFTPARYDALLGLRFPARPSAFPTKDQMADYLERYAATFELPVVTGVRVDGLRRAGDGGYIVAPGDELWQAPQVVLATGAYAEPPIPDFARELDPRIFQLHASAYRNPAQLRAGEVLVVGAGNSGSEIALDAARGHHTWLSGRDPGHIPVSIDGRACQVIGRLLSYLDAGR